MFTAFSYTLNPPLGQPPNQRQSPEERHNSCNSAYSYWEWGHVMVMWYMVCFRSKNLYLLRSFDFFVSLFRFTTWSFSHWISICAYAATSTVLLSTVYMLQPSHQTLPLLTDMGTLPPTCSGTQVEWLCARMSNHIVNAPLPNKNMYHYSIPTHTLHSHPPALMLSAILQWPGQCCSDIAASPPAYYQLSLLFLRALRASWRLGER